VSGLAFRFSERYVIQNPSALSGQAQRLLPSKLPAGSAVLQCAMWLRELVLAHKMT